MKAAVESRKKWVLPAEDLARLFEELANRKYRLVGPTKRDGSIVLDQIESVDDLPIGWTLDQDAGSCSLRKEENGAYFSFSSGPHSFKKYLFPPRLKLWEARKQGASFETSNGSNKEPKYAFFGVHACDLKAIAIQDRVFMGDVYSDSVYVKRRKQAFIVAVNCLDPGSLCFCDSMGAGPEARTGFDILLTEKVDKEEHVFIAESKGKAGKAVLDSLDLKAASSEDVQWVESSLEDARSKMGRKLETDGLRELLERNFEHPRWDEIAKTCLGCTNCTMVCPTCFCSTVEDVTSLGGDVAERWRRWDSCFTEDFTYFAGGAARASIKSRYRQWLTHKLSTWIGQFDTIGCVGCGRCIAWCPVGIDFTKEVAAMHATDRASEITSNQNLS